MRKQAALSQAQELLVLVCNNNKYIHTSVRDVNFVKCAVIVVVLFAASAFAFHSDSWKKYSARFCSICDVYILINSNSGSLAANKVKIKHAKAVKFWVLFSLNNL